MYGVATGRMTILCRVHGKTDLAIATLCVTIGNGLRSARRRGVGVYRSWLGLDIRPSHRHRDVALPADLRP